MRRAVLSCSVLAVLLVGMILAAALPAQAEYTKLYKCQNTYDFDQGYLRAITNALEVITPGGTTSWPLQWNPPLVGSCLWNGVYCTKLRYGGVTPYVIPGAWGKIGWTTADNSCRLSDFRWLAPSGKPWPAIDPIQLGGVPGGGEVWYDATAHEYIWLIINDTGYPINLSDVTLEVLNAPPPLDEYDLLPMSAAGLMRTAAAPNPHPDIVALRVDRVRDRYVTPLREEVDAALAAGHLLAEDAATLTGHLDAAETALAAGVAAYDPADPGAAEAQWDEAVTALTAFKALVREFAGLPAETAALSIPSPFAPHPTQARLASVADRLWDPLVFSLACGRSPLGYSTPAGGGRS